MGWASWRQSPSAWPFFPGFVLLGDLDQYARWAHHLATDLPFGAAYQQDFSYMPVLVGVFGALAHLVPAFETAGDASTVAVRVALKVPALLGELAIVAGLLTLLRHRPSIAGAAILAFLLVPATWYIGAWWGQLDAVYVALCLWAAILASRDRPWLFAVVLGLAMMTKPQALFLAAPFAGYAIGRWGVRRSALVGLVAIAVALLTWLPFLPYGGAADYLRNLDYYQNNQYPILSMRAWNPWWLVQVAFAGDRFVLDSTPVLGPLTPRYLGFIVAALGEILVFVAVMRRATTDAAVPGPGGGNARRVLPDDLDARAVCIRRARLPRSPPGPSICPGSLGNPGSHDQPERCCRRATRRGRPDRPAHGAGRHHGKRRE